MLDRRRANAFSDDRRRAFAFSDDRRRATLNCGSLALVMVYVSMIMPKTLEKPKKERGQPARQPGGPAKA